jgi:MFS transporter, FSR family, fosmidomycin resistance protein
MNPNSGASPEKIVNSVLATISFWRFLFNLIDKFQVSIRSAQMRLFLFFGTRRRRHHPGWAPRGPHPPQTGHPGCNPWRIALHPAPALREPLLDPDPERRDRARAVLGLFRDPGLCPRGAALLGVLADRTNIRFAYQVCSFLPLLGILTAFLPDGNKPAKIIGTAT